MALCTRGITTVVSAHENLDAMREHLAPPGTDRGMWAAAVAWVLEPHGMFAGWTRRADLDGTELSDRQMDRLMVRKSREHKLTLITRDGEVIKKKGPMEGVLPVIPEDFARRIISREEGRAMFLERLERAAIDWLTSEPVTTRAWSRCMSFSSSTSGSGNRLVPARCSPRRLDSVHSFQARERLLACQVGSSSGDRRIRVANTPLLRPLCVRAEGQHATDRDEQIRANTQVVRIVDGLVSPAKPPSPVQIRVAPREEPGVTAGCFIFSLRIRSGRSASTTYCSPIIADGHPPDLRGRPAQGRRQSQDRRARCRGHPHGACAKDVQGPPDVRPERRARDRVHDRRDQDAHERGLSTRRWRAQRDAASRHRRGFALRGPIAAVTATSTRAPSSSAWIPCGAHVSMSSSSASRSR